jgi:Alpha/beta hydrolase family
MLHVTSKDGTAIAHDRRGDGPAVVLVGGALDDGSENAPLAQVLAEWFTVYNYARRGRGESGDTPPYAVEREIEDIEALVAEAGGSAHLYGVSSGGALALQAAAAGVPADRLAVYEIPLGWPTPADAERFRALLAEGRRGDMLELFMRTAGSFDEAIAGARSSPVWPGMEALAQTLAYDAACMGNGHPPIDRFAKVTRPTLVTTGWDQGRPVHARPGARLLRAGRGHHRREHPGGGAGDLRGSGARGRPQRGRPAPGTVLRGVIPRPL